MIFFPKNVYQYFSEVFETGMRANLYDRMLMVLTLMDLLLQIPNHNAFMFSLCYYILFVICFELFAMTHDYCSSFLNLNTVLVTAKSHYNLISYFSRAVFITNRLQ